MTRRNLVGLLMAGAASAPACSIRGGGPQRGLISICNSGHFAILGARRGLNSRSELVPSAITARGLDAGQLQLASSPPPHLLSLSPDGAWVAWVPENSLPDSYGRGGQPLVCFTDDPRSARTLSYDGWFGIRIAVSSDAVRLAVIALGTVGSRLFYRLLVLRPTTGETADDLTGVAAGIDLGKVDRLRLSSSGARLVVGSGGSFAVMDLQERSVLFKGAGRYPCISPSGEEVAFVDPRGKLALVGLATGVTRYPLRSGTAYGVGSWTPDGSMLLAFVKTPLALDAGLVVIDGSTGGYAEITSLDEWNLGQDCALVKIALLTATRIAR